MKACSDHKSRLIFVSKKCRSPWCPNCGKAYWGKVRGTINPHIKLFKRAKVLTLTIDRKKFANGLDAYLYIEKEHGYIRRFLRLFGFKKAFKVMAFHSDKAKNGSYNPDNHNWPHWHIVVDLADVGGYVDLKRAWRIWREQWGVGGFDLDTKKRYANSDKAVNYCVSYCQHNSDSVADWVLGMGRAPRVYEFYGDLRKAVTEKRKKDLGDIELETVETTDLPVRDERPEPETRELVANRIESCNDSCIALYEFTDWFGNLKYSYAGTLPYTPDHLIYLSRLNYISHPFDIEPHYSDDSMVTSLRISYETNEPERAIKELVSACSRCPDTVRDLVPI